MNSILLSKSSETNISESVIYRKSAVRNFMGLKMISNQYLSKYITSQCSKLSPYGSGEILDEGMVSDLLSGVL